MRHDDRVLKDEARDRVRATRRARMPQERARLAEAIASAARELIEGRPPSDIAAYVSMAAEPGTGPLLSSLLRAGHRVLLPRTLATGLAWVPFDGEEPLVAGPFGLQEPMGDALPEPVLASVALALIPALAVDRHGVRLGQGGGYYDRAFADVASHAQGGPLRVAVVFDDEVRDDVPSEPHDCRVDAALTPSGVLHFDG